MPLSIHGTNGITFNDGSTQNTRPAVGFRNRIINGDMRIDQRNAGASLSIANTGLYSVDRWRISNSVSTITAQQSSSIAPTRFGYSLGLTVNTTDNTGSHAIQQFVEGFNFSDLAWGTSSASPITLSFWVRSSLTGIYGVGFQNSAQNRSYVSTYTINSANTWEQKVITVLGDTSGTWVGATNGIGLSLEFDLGSSSSFNQGAESWGTTNNARRTSSCVNWANTSGATFYITGVQLEAGSTATDFERRPIGTELALCQRYYWQMSSIADTKFFFQGYMYYTTQFEGIVPFPVQMRSQPTMTSSTPSRFGLRISGNALTGLFAYASAGEAPFTSMLLYTSNSAVSVIGYAQSVISNSGNPTFIGFSAEL